MGPAVTARTSGGCRRSGAAEAVAAAASWGSPRLSARPCPPCLCCPAPCSTKFPELESLVRNPLEYAKVVQTIGGWVGGHRTERWLWQAWLAGHAVTAMYDFELYPCRGIVA